MKKLYLGFAVIFVVMVVTFYMISIMTQDNREETLKRDMKDYYEKYLKGKVIGVNTHQVSLEMLQKTNYDIEEYKDCDLKESFSYIKIEDDKVTVENHLKCDKK